MSKITIYTTSTCAPCKTLCNLLDYKQIAYEKILIDDNPELMNLVKEKTGRGIVPAVEINGKWISGYNPSAILRLANE